MAYLLRDGTLTRVDLAKHQTSSDDSGGPGIPTGSNWDVAQREIDSANLTNRPPMAPWANAIGDPSEWRELMGDVADLYPPTIKSGPATTWTKCATAADGSLAAYTFNRGGGRVQWLVKGADGRRHQYSRWSDVAGLADWRNGSGGAYRGPLAKSSSLHPNTIEFSGGSRIGTKMLDGGDSGALYSVPDGTDYVRLHMRRADGSLYPIDGRYPISAVEALSRHYLQDTTSGVLHPKKGTRNFNDLKQAD